MGLIIIFITNAFSSVSVIQIISVVKMSVDISFTSKEKIQLSCLIRMIFYTWISTKVFLTLKVLGSCIYFGSVFILCLATL